MNLTAEQRIQKSHVRLMSHQATMAFSGLVMVGESTVQDDIPIFLRIGDGRHK